MTVCSGCSRHYKFDEVRCPFCSTRPSSRGTKALNAVGGAVTTIILAACYGGAETDTDKTEPPDDSGITLVTDGNTIRIKNNLTKKSTWWYAQVDLKE